MIFLLVTLIDEMLLILITMLAGVDVVIDDYVNMN